MTPFDTAVHLAAGKYFGRSATCGVKVRWTTEEKANLEADRLFQSNPRKDLEAYPCYFCSPREQDIFYWHVGRALTTEEYNVFAGLGGDSMEMEDVTVTGGQQLRVHNRKMCEGSFCCIHNPSGHHMVSWPMNWRTDFGNKMERICPHGIGHPDPDDTAFQLRTLGEAHDIHGCDGCCRPVHRTPED